MANELKGCPFCGGEAKLSYNRGNENINQTWAVKCTKCPCFGSHFTGTNTWESYSKEKEIADRKAEQKAIEWWNRRASPEPLTLPEIAGLVDACKANVEGEFLVEFVRAIEAAHGIKEAGE